MERSSSRSRSPTERRRVDANERTNPRTRDRAAAREMLVRTLMDIETELARRPGFLQSGPFEGLMEELESPEPLESPVASPGANQSLSQELTGSRKDKKLTTEAALSKKIVEAFGQNSDEKDEEITDIEEMVFQKVLLKKMICDICMTKMKEFRCSKCSYSMCEGCADKISFDGNGNVSCPHCREKQEYFMQIRLPRL